MQDDDDRKQNDAGKRHPGVLKNAPDKNPQEYRWSLGRLPSFSSVAFWEWDIVKEVCRYSDEWTGIIGEDNYSSAQQNNWSWWSGRMHMDDMLGILDAQKKFFEAGQSEVEIIFRLRRPDGRWVRILSRGVVAEWGDDGRPTVMSGLCMDISHIAMDPPLPDDSLSPTDAGTRNSGDPRSTLNERCLTALYQLTQMENASEEEVLHFAVSSILQLTNSASGFFFIPEPDAPDRGLFFRVRGEYTRPGPLHGAADALPEDLAHLAVDADLFAGKSRIVNGDGIPLDQHRKSMSMTRYILVPGMEKERVVCLAGVYDRPSDYGESDLRQIEMFVRTVWLILQRRRRILELEQAKEVAEAADRVKGEFLANVSHELRTPLNGILGMLQLLEDASITEQEREFLDTAHLSGKALVRIISDILDFSRIESGKMPLERELFDFKASVASSLRIFREEAEKRNLAFVMEIDPAIPDMLWGDDTRIRQIIFNLVGNALKFTKEGSITVSCALASEPHKKRATLGISVADTGIGIPKDKQGSLFNAFTRVDTFFSKKYSGTGLGLSIVKRLVEMMDGSVCLDSEPGRGTLISCTVVLDMPRPRDRKREASHPAGGESREPLDILVAEDDAVGRFAMRAFLQRGGHKVVCVRDGKQALEALQLYPFDCLLTDIQMPDMDGLELARNIRQGRAYRFPPSAEVRALVRDVFPDMPETLTPVNPDITIVAVSAHTMAGDRERFLRQGVTHYIAKPIVMRQLFEVLDRVPGRNGKY